MIHCCDVLDPILMFFTKFFSKWDPTRQVFFDIKPQDSPQALTINMMHFVFQQNKGNADFSLAEKDEYLDELEARASAGAL